LEPLNALNDAEGAGGLIDASTGCSVIGVLLNR